MTASSMNTFLRKLFENSPDYKLLTQRVINNAFMEHMQLSILKEEDRQLLKDMTQIMFNKMMEIDANNQSDSERESPILKKSHSNKINKYLSDGDDNLSEDLADANSKNTEISTNITELENKTPKITEKIINKDNNSEKLTDINSKNPLYINSKKNSNSTKVNAHNGDADNINSDIDSNISGIEDNKHVLSDADQKTSDDDSDETNVRIVISNKNKRKLSSPSSVSQSDSNDMPSPGESKKCVKKKGKKRRKETEKGVELMMLAADGSSDEEITLNQLKSRIHTDKKHNSNKKNITEKKSIKMVAPKEKKSQRLKQLEKIARTCGIYPFGINYTRTFEGCENEKDKIKVIKQLLKHAGMEGPISIEKAELIKLKKEAAELNTNNILSSNGRGVRNVLSIYSRHQKQAEPIDRPPLKNKLKNLRDIIDSDSE